mmetsp:Transcript_100428/g.199342  ORF Transcript_100428/g.199342 Transcript_100428/m.199342 type:complete len:1000 (+) Transcript_100428:39-3038(+)
MDPDGGDGGSEDGGLLALLGDQLWAGEDDMVDVLEALEEKHSVGLLFAQASHASELVDLKTSYDTALAERGFEIIFVPCDALEAKAESDAAFEDMPWLALPFLCEQKQALQDKYRTTQELPKMVIVDRLGGVLVADGLAKVAADPTGETFPWNEETATLSENDIMVKMGPVPPQPGESGLKGIFINAKNYLTLGLVDEVDEADDVPFSGMKLRPYVKVSKQAALDEVKRMGFASDWHPMQKSVEKFPGDELLLIFDPERGYDEKLILPITEDAFEREWARIEEARQKVLDDFENSQLAEQQATAEQDEEPEETIVVRDLPRDCGDWFSETMDATHDEVGNLQWPKNSRPPMKLMISRPRKDFGKNPVKFSDTGELVHNVRPTRDPSFTTAAAGRRELEIGIQNVKDTRTCASQTTWNRPVNKSTQYSPDHFLRPKTGAKMDNKIDELSAFLSAVSNSVEEALQTNETVDIFQEEFRNLGDEEAAGISKSDANMDEHRNFYDVTYTKGKRIEWVEWVPNSTDMIACACCEDLPFAKSIENAGKATQSTVLIWSFGDTLVPHCIVHAPWEVTTFKFYPSDEKYLIGGLASGQIIIWKLSDADLGHAARDKNKNKGAEQEKGVPFPAVSHKHISLIDDCHRRPVTGLEFLPGEMELGRKGHVTRWDSASRDAAVRYLLSVAGDGQVLIWDLQALLEGLTDNEFVWRPMHRIQLQRQDSGTEMSLCHILYCRSRTNDKGEPMRTNFFASTEEGELIFGDWAASAGEDRKPDYMKKMFTVSKTFRPMLSLERSKFFPDILLGVTDWAFYLWKDGLDEHIFQSSYTAFQSSFTRGVWSPTRPSVIFLGLASGGIDIWDFSDQSHKASLSDSSGSSTAISSMSFLLHGDPLHEQYLAVGTAHGHLHVLAVPKNLVKPAGRENDAMRKFLDHEVERVTYLQGRRQELLELKEQLEKKAQRERDGQADEAEKPPDSSNEDQAKQDALDEDAYQRLEADCLELLKTGAV